MPLRRETWEKLADEWKVPQMEAMIEEIPLAELVPTIERMLDRKRKGRAIVKLTD
jgi:hypothetical protein